MLRLDPPNYYSIFGTGSSLSYPRPIPIRQGTVLNYVELKTPRYSVLMQAEVPEDKHS